MNETIEQILADIATAGNMRAIPEADMAGGVDFSSNDYLGLAARTDLRDGFFSTLRPDEIQMSASASRLLAGRQSAFTAFEGCLKEAYAGREALLFNSGYHANTGITSAFAGSGYYILADKLVHASIIDGIRLSGLPFARFRHNDYGHLARLAEKTSKDGYKLIIIAESVYSMDGDRADIDALAEIKRRYQDSILYIDEAHAVGVEGPGGLGLCMASSSYDDIDIIVGTLGKALASTGAYAILKSPLRSFMVNKARSLIFSTALPPLCVKWSQYIFERCLGMEAEREQLRRLSQTLADELLTIGGQGYVSHIQGVICGTPQRAVQLSHKLAEEGFTVLPIRTPTVPPGTDRLRLSLSANITPAQISSLGNALRKLYENNG